MRWLFVFPLLFSNYADGDIKKEIIQRHKLRYEDFFERQRIEEMRDKERMSGKDEVREKRQEEKELHERARKHYVATKPPPRDNHEAFQRHLELERIRHLEYLKKQERYAEMQNEIEKIKEGALKIPPVLEYQLQDAL